MEVKSCMTAAQPKQQAAYDRAFVFSALKDGMAERPTIGGTLLTVEEWEQVAREAQFNAAKMAGVCCISERQLQRLFKKHLGCTPSHWLRELQCRLARDLISRGYSNKAAALELKFATESHLCREFKKVFGVSPQSFAPGHCGTVKSDTQARITKKSWAVLGSAARRT